MCQEMVHYDINSLESEGFLHEDAQLVRLYSFQKKDYYDLEGLLLASIHDKHTRCLNTVDKFNNFYIRANY